MEPEFLNDAEKDAVRYFNEAEVMREAVKKVLLKALYSSGTLKPGAHADPLKNIALVFVSNARDASNEQVGAEVRALYQGINAIEVGFGELASYKKEVPKEPKINKAR